MFHDTLLESAPAGRQRKRWPMVLAVALEVAVCSLLIVLPLFSTGIVPVSARVPVVLPRFQPVQIVTETPPPGGPSGPSGPHSAMHPLVVSVGSVQSVIHFGPPASPNADADVPPNFPAGPAGPPNMFSSCDTAKPHLQRVRVSAMSEGFLIYRIDPVYPKIGPLIHLQGEVKLHAIIAKDGSIQSLTVISGHPMLAIAALDAVRQWRYRPYLLNQEPVEVETLITVNFKSAP